MLSKLQSAAFEIIAYVGDAKSKYVRAVELIQQGNNEEASLALIKQGNEQLNNAHKCHFEFIQLEANGESLPYSMLFMHAEDQLLTTQTFRDLVEMIINLHKTIHLLKEEKEV